MIKVPVKYLKPLDFLFIYRPTLFFSVWLVSLAGYAAYFEFSDIMVWWSIRFDWLVLLNFIMLTLAAGATFILNQMQDIGTDKANNKLFLISESYVPPKTAQRIAIGSMTIPLLYFLLTNRTVFLLVLIFLFLWGYAYNYRPLQWKDKPLLGVAANILGGLFLFLIGWSLAGRFQWQAVSFAIPYLFAVASHMLLTTVPDMEGDAEHEKRTFAVCFGRKATLWVSFSCLAAAFVIGFLNQDPVITHPVLLAFPIYIVTLLRPTDVWVFRAIRFPMLFLALFLSVKFPLFFVVILINFYLDRIYYINRFELDYPTFRVEEQEQ